MLTEQTASGEVSYARGEGHSFGAAHVHRLVNTGRAPAVSVHAYGPALKAMTRYRWEGSRLAVEGVDRAGAQW